MSITSGVLTAAYAREYSSRKALLEALNDGKDFLINTPMRPPQLCSIRDVGTCVLEVRYGKRDQRVTTVSFRDGIAS